MLASWPIIASARMHADPLAAKAIAKLRAMGLYDLPPVRSPFAPHSTTDFYPLDARPCARAHTTSKD